MHSNIFWTRDSVPAVTKMGLHLWQVGEWEKEGRPIPTRSAEFPDQFRGKVNGDRYIEVAGHINPEFWPWFRENSTGHKFGDGRALTDRTWNSIIHDEIARFRQPEWAPLYNMVRNHVRQMRPITAADRFAAHAKMVRASMQGRPGVYVHQDAERQHIIYLGKADNTAARAYRNNGTLMLVRAYATVTGVVAGMLEQQLHEYLVRESGLVERVMFPERPVGKQGTYWLTTGVNGLCVLDQILEHRYGNFCRALVGIDIEPIQPRRYGLF